MIRKTITPPQSPLRSALRHVREGRARIKKQQALVETLRADGHNTEKAEEFLERFMTIQLEFEKHYRTLLAEGQEKLRASGYKDPLDDEPED
jgi:hypothetical protein